MTTLRLDRLLSNLGYGSRKEISQLVKAGRVVLGGERIKRQDESIALLDVRNGLLTLDGEQIDPPSPLTVMFNKPRGYTCSHDKRVRSYMIYCRVAGAFANPHFLARAGWIRKVPVR